MTAQAFRPHVLDMFEPQNHPDDIPYPGGPPTPPYDNAGWTLAYQMGVEFDRILDPFSGPFVKLTGFAPVPAGTVAATPVASGWYAWARTNDGFAAANRLLKAGQEVHVLTRDATAGGRAWPAGTFVARATPAATPMVRALATERGVSFTTLAAQPEAGAMKRMSIPRIGLWDVYGGSMSSGWMRFVFEQFEFPYENVFAKDLDSADLNARYDVLILPDDASLAQTDTARGFEFRGQPPVERVPEEWRNRLGRITVAKTLPRLRAFVENGGTLLAVGDAAAIAYQLELPVSNAIVGDDDKPLPRAKYYVPGSVLSVAVDTSNPVAWGMNGRTDIFFDNNPAFRIKGDGSAKRVAWFDSEAPLRSGWAWGQKVLDGAAQVVVAPVGKGEVILYGPQVHFRGQTHGAFPFLFNGVFYGQSR